MKDKIEIDFDKGIIYRLFKNNIKKEVGTKRKDGYLRFWSNGKTISNHRFIYEQYHKVKLKPDEHINHINHKKDDNRICNLEVVNNQQNSQYKGLTTSNTGFKNIRYEKDRNKYRIQLKINYRSETIGRFDSLQEAIIKRNEVINKLNKDFDYKYTIIDENDTNILFNTFFVDL